MANSKVLERIDAWQAAGLLDEATAERLRAVEAASEPDAPTSRRGIALSAIFGPGVTVAEVFGYLGAGFLYAAWLVIITRGGELNGLGLVASGLFLAALGFVARGSSPRFARAAGVAFVVAAASLGAGVFQLLRDGSLVTKLPEVAAAATWLAAATGFRRLHRALTTQTGLIAAVLAATAVAMDVLEDMLFNGAPSYDPEVASSPIRVILIGLGWGAAAVILALIGLHESRGADPGARARAALTRLAAGLTAIFGAATAVFASGPTAGKEYEWGRIIEPVIGDAILMVVSAVLLERAFRRQASAFVYPAALGVIIGLSDLNAQYFAEATSPQLALLVEGVILLAAGLAFDRLRRRIGLLPEDDHDAHDDDEPSVVAPETGAA